MSKNIFEDNLITLQSDFIFPSTYIDLMKKFVSIIQKCYIVLAVKHDSNNIVPTNVLRRLHT